MINLPFSMTIDEARDFYLNGAEVMKTLPPEAADVWPRPQNDETLIHDANGRTLYSVSTKEVFTGPRKGGAEA